MQLSSLVCIQWILINKWAENFFLEYCQKVFNVLSLKIEEIYKVIKHYQCNLIFCQSFRIKYIIIFSVERRYWNANYYALIDKIIHFVFFLQLLDKEVKHKFIDMISILNLVLITYFLIPYLSLLLRVSSNIYLSLH